MTPAPDTGRTAEEKCANERLVEHVAQLHANLIALAKMYGEACGALAEYRFAAVEWQGEQAEYKAAVEAEAAQIRSRLLEAEQGAEATGWRRTGTSSHPVGGGRGVDQWFRPSDGSLQMFPTGFDPNSGTYGPAILHGGHTIYLCPGDTFVPAPDPLNPNQEAGDGSL